MNQITPLIGAFFVGGLVGIFLMRYMYTRYYYFVFELLYHELKNNYLDLMKIRILYELKILKRGKKYE